MKHALIVFLLAFACLHAGVIGDDGSRPPAAGPVEYKILPFDTPAQSVFDARKSFVPRDRLAVTHGTGALWASLTINNPGRRARQAVLETRYAKFQYLDVYLFEQGVLVRTYRRGLMQNSGLYDFFVRPNAVTLELPAGSSVTVLVAMRSPRIDSLKIALLEPRAYLKELLLQTIILVLLVGIIFSAIAYNLSLYLNARLKAFVYYALGGLFFLVQVYFQFGFSTWLNPGFAPIFSTVGFFVCASLIYFPLIRFAQTFFETKQRFPKLHRILQALLIVFGVFAVLFAAAPFDSRIFLAAPVWSLLHPFALMTFVVLGIAAALRRFPGALFYLGGQTFFYALISYNILLAVLKESGTNDAFIMYAFGLAVDIVFVAQALGTKIKEIEKREAAYKKAMQISAQEKAIAVAVKNISHQWSAPLIQLGALMTKLEFSMERNTGTGGGDIETVRRANDLIVYMDDLTQKYRELYGTDATPETIDLPQLVGKVEALLKQMLDSAGAVLTLEYDRSAEPLVANANVLMQILVILTDNAVGVALQRGIRHPAVVVRYGVQNTHRTLSVEDNAGGIDTEPPDRVFEQNMSQKKNGLGYGLFLARQLCGSMLNAEMRVHNTKLGACFRIVFG